MKILEQLHFLKKSLKTTFLLQLYLISCNFVLLGNLRIKHVNVNLMSFKTFVNN